MSSVAGLLCVIVKMLYGVIDLFFPSLAQCSAHTEADQISHTDNMRRGNKLQWQANDTCTELLVAKLTLPPGEIYILINFNSIMCIEARGEEGI